MVSRARLAVLVLVGLLFIMPAASVTLAAAPTGTVTLRSAPWPPPDALISSVQSLDLSTGEVGTLSNPDSPDIGSWGDFYFYDNPSYGGQWFYANNEGEQGVRDATDGGAFTRYGVPVVVGHRYEVIVEPGYTGSFVVSAAQSHQVTLRYTFSAIRKIDPATACQCVVYVQKYTGHFGTGSADFLAKDSGPYLERMGHTKYVPASTGPTPSVGDIIVLQPGFAGAFSAGHIGFVAGWSFDKKGNLTIVMQSANWSSKKLYTDAGCSNVSLVPISVSSASLVGEPAPITFFRR